MKQITAVTIAVLLLTTAVTVSAHAGAARRHTIEGFMLGTGVAILGAAIINEIHKDSAHRPAVGYHTPPPPRHKTHHYAKQRRYAGHSKQYRHDRRTRGHWEVSRTWIDPVYEKKWNPGHYRRNGEWIPGRYERFVVKQGYWQEQKVWVWH